MPNRKENAGQARSFGKATSGHETALLNTFLKFPLKGTKEQVQNELSSVMRIQIAFIFKAIEDGTATVEDEDVVTAMNIWYECSLAQHYLHKGIAL